MKSMILAGAVALALAGGAGYAQDGDKKCGGCEAGSSDCGMAGILCPKDGKCEGKCKEICTKAAATLKAVRARIGELMKKEVGQQCPCTVGGCCEKECPSCETVKTKIFAPILKDRVNARFTKEGFKEAKHAGKDAEGKATETACTFLSGDTCTPCVNEMADAMWAKMKELFAAKKETK